uniref:Secreted protein n=1 Tax=Panagrolaimus sp. PS1159 TaxID=55785 RepID=A0AC35GBA0_9BILA
MLTCFGLLIWCCCIRGTTRGKYEVMRNENQPLPSEPDPEAGIAYPGRSDEASEQPLLMASVSRSSIKAENPRKDNCDDPFGTPQQSTLASPLGHPTSLYERRK